MHHKKWIVPYYLLFTECSQHPLGMEDGAILGSQITASSEYTIKTRAGNGRLNFVATKDRTGAWSAKTNDVNQWLQVDLLGQADVSEVQTQGREDCCNQFVTTFTISYSEDGTTFTNYTQNTRRVKVRNKENQLKRLFKVFPVKHKINIFSPLWNILSVSGSPKVCISN